MRLRSANALPTTRVCPAMPRFRTTPPETPRLTTKLGAASGATCLPSQTAHQQPRHRPTQSARHKGLCITRSPDSNTITHQEERQPRTVKLMRVRRATARGSNDPSADKAGGFMHELAGAQNNGRFADSALRSLAQTRNRLLALLLRQRPRWHMQ